MDILTNRYFSNTRFFLVLAGQWPFHHTKVKQLKRAVACFCFASFIIVQGLIKFSAYQKRDIHPEFFLLLIPKYELRDKVFDVLKIILSNGDAETLLGNFPFITFYTLSGVKYFTCWIQRGIIKEVFQHIENDMFALMSKKEGKILRMYTNEGYVYGKFYTYLAIALLGGFTIILYTPSVLDLYLPLNETRRAQVLFNFEFFVAHPKYQYSFIWYVQLCFIVGAITVLAADLTYITIMFHACGMFSVIGYKLEHLFDDLHEINNISRSSVTRKRIVETVQLQWRTDKLINNIIPCYSVSYVLQWIIVILSISSILSNVYRGLSSNNTSLVIVFSVDLIVHYLLLFLNILPAQKLINCSTNIFYDALNGLWYETSVETQKLLSFMLLKTMKPTALAFPGIMKITLETFSKIVKISFSCFMVIRTMQQ